MLLYKLVMFVLCFPDEFFPSHNSFLYFFFLRNNFFFLNNDTYFFNLYFYDQSLDFESYQEYLFHFRGDAFVFCCALSKGLSFHVVLVHLSSCVVFVDVFLLLVEPGHPVLACPSSLDCHLLSVYRKQDFDFGALLLKRRSLIWW